MEELKNHLWNEKRKEERWKVVMEEMKKVRIQSRGVVERWKRKGGLCALVGESCK